MKNLINILSLVLLYTLSTCTNANQNEEVNEIMRNFTPNYIKFLA